MKKYKSLILATMCLFLLVAAGCSQKEEANKSGLQPETKETKEESVNLTGNYHTKNSNITIQITDENKIIFHEETKDSLKVLMETLILEKMKMKPKEGFMEALLDGLQSGSEFTKTDTQLIFYPVEDDSFSLNVKYFNDGTIVFLNESYEK